MCYHHGNEIVFLGVVSMGQLVQVSIDAVSMGQLAQGSLDMVSMGQLVQVSLDVVLYTCPYCVISLPARVGLYRWPLQT